MTHDIRLVAALVHDNDSELFTKDCAYASIAPSTSRTNSVVLAADTEPMPPVIVTACSPGYLAKQNEWRMIISFTAAAATAASSSTAVNPGEAAVTVLGVTGIVTQVLESVQ